MDCEIFRCPQVKESPRQYLLPNRYFTENSRWVPLFNFIGLRLTQGIKVDFIYVFIIVFPTNPASSYTGKMFRNGKEKV